jgi:ribosomal protein S18 acetylase RimI-like enzyme
MSIEMRTITREERGEFLEMAEQFFLYLNPRFVPHADWEEHYFENILGNCRFSLRWILVDGLKVGYILFGLENHLFLPRQSGTVYAIYIQPEMRRKGIARICAEQAISELRAQSPSKIQLEIMEGNQAAMTFWESLGFERVSSRFVLRTTAR